MTTTHHLTDALLLGRADGEVALGRDDARHLLACGDCRARVQYLEHASTRLAVMLAAVDTPASAIDRVRAANGRALARRRPPRRRLSLGWAAAAAAVVSVTALAAPSLLRMVERPVAVAPGTAADAGRPVAPAPEATENIVSFAMHGSALRVTFSSAPAAGTVSLTATDDPGPAVFITRGGNVEVVVLPAELRVLNAGKPSTRFELRVPTAVRMVEMRVQGSDALLYRGRVTPGGRISVP